MFWKTPQEHILVKGAPEPIPYVRAGVRLSGGDVYERAAAYYELSPAGELLKTYAAPSCYSEAGEMWVWFYAVADCSLIKVEWHENFHFGAAGASGQPEIKISVLERPLFNLWTIDERDLSFAPETVIRRCETPVTAAVLSLEYRLFRLEIGLRERLSGYAPAQPPNAASKRYVCYAAIHAGRPHERAAEKIADAVFDFWPEIKGNQFLEVGMRPIEPAQIKASAADLFLIFRENWQYERVEAERFSEFCWYMVDSEDGESGSR
jgi:hypothetical protein